MKKVLALVLALTLCVSALTALTACACSRGSGSLSGTYSLKSMTIGGNELDIGMLSALGLSGDDFMSLRFNDDGSMRVVINGEASTNASYTIDGNRITITSVIGLGTIEGTIDGNRIILNVGGQRVTFEKK